MEVMRFEISLKLLLVLTTASLLCQHSAGLDENDPEFWRNEGDDELLAALQAAAHDTTNVAQAVILFIGDGFSIATLTASRIYKGQQEGKPGEETKLSFEQFPHFGYSKTYNTNYQVPDSAGTATAYLTGVKTKRRVIGLDAGSGVSECQPTTMSHRVDSIAKMAKEAGMAVGLVTTTRVTHASPATVYAHVSDRDWESSVPNTAARAGCKDIALQLVESDFNIDVVFGGGRRAFLPDSVRDPETNSLGKRKDGRNLIDEWQQKYQQMGTAQYVWNQTSFDAVDTSTTDYILGLFDFDHMQFEHERGKDKAGEPSLAEMTEKAVRLLRRKNERFFLFVEGGRIDHANHLDWARAAVSESVSFEQSIQRSVELTTNDTLIVVTSDHAHTLTISGYPQRGHDILGKLDSDGRGLPYTTLGYANGLTGLSVKSALQLTGERPNLTDIDTDGDGYKQQALVMIASETHGGEDVAIFARGPMAHLFHSVHEQNYIMHVMQYAACIGDYTDRCSANDPMTTPYDVTDNGGSRDRSPWLVLVAVALLLSVNRIL